MGTILLVLFVCVIVAGVAVTRALERRRAARVAAWIFEPADENDDLIELDERDLRLLPPPPPAAAFHHHVHAH